MFRYGSKVEDKSRNSHVGEFMGGCWIPAEKDSHNLGRSTFLTDLKAMCNNQRFSDIRYGLIHNSCCIASLRFYT
jgi:hypothetical protein